MTADTAQPPPTQEDVDQAVAELRASGRLWIRDDPDAPTQEDVDRAVYDATHDKGGNPIPIVAAEPLATDETP